MDERKPISYICNYFKAYFILYCQKLVIMVTNEDPKNKGEKVFSYSGDISPETTDAIIQQIENTIDSYDQLTRLKKRILAISIEVLQNLYHHGLKTEETEEQFDIIVDGNYCYLVSSNGVDAGTVHALEKSIEHINQLSDEDLKKYYIEKLNNQQFSDKGGGGLGLIDIARKSGTKLGYNFNAVNDKQYNFVLTAKLTL